MMNGRISGTILEDFYCDKARKKAYFAKANPDI